LKDLIDLRLKVTFASPTIPDKFADHYFMRAFLASENLKLVSRLEIENFDDSFSEILH
jgi:hypothetical protein